MNRSLCLTSLTTLSLLLSGCATFSSSHSSPFGPGLTPPEAHVTASELTGPLEIIPMPLWELGYSSLSDFKGPIRQVTRYRLCRGPCQSEDMDQKINFDEVGRVSESLTPYGPHLTYYYAGDSEHPYRKNSRSNVRARDTYYRRDEYGNVLSLLNVSEGGEPSPARYVFRHHADQYSFRSIARSLDPAYSKNSAPGSLMFRDGRMVKRVMRMGTIDVSAGRNGPSVDSVDEWDYVSYPSSGVLMLKRQRNFSNGQHTGTEEALYSPEGLDMLATSEVRAIGSSEISYQHETRYQQYVLDEYDNWVSRQSCTTVNQRPEECSQQQRVITYY